MTTVAALVCALASSASWASDILEIGVAVMKKGGDGKAVVEYSDTLRVAPDAPHARSATMKFSRGAPSVELLVNVEAERISRGTVLTFQYELNEQDVTDGLASAPGSETKADRFTSSAKQRFLVEQLPLPLDFSNHDGSRIVRIISISTKPSTEPDAALATGT
jgi:hypothetical protein